MNINNEFHVRISGDSSLINLNKYDIETLIIENKCIISITGIPIHIYPLSSPVPLKPVSG